MVLSIDIETYSDVDLKKSGLFKYVESPAFEVLLFAYSYNGGPVKVVDLACGERIPNSVIQDLNNEQCLKTAFNAAFEWCCLSRAGFIYDMYKNIHQWQCTMVHSLYCGYPASLAAAGEAIGLGQDKKKLGIGGALIRTFCVPCKPTKNNGQRTRTLPHHEPDKWKLFKDYNRQDVVTEMAIAQKLKDLPMKQSEQKLWCLDMIMNARGVAVDLNLVNKALEIDAAITSDLMDEAITLSGLKNPKSVQQLAKWLEEETDEEITDLKKDTVKILLSADTMPDKARRMLEIRQEISKTSIKKYASMSASACSDSRIKGLLQFYGANRTGRWAGRLVQVQNLKKNHLKMLGYARELTIKGKLDALEYIYGSIPDTISQLIRTAFVPAEGNTFVIADFSAIEARVIAWLADERWRLDVFATHGKIYEASASAMFGVPLEQIDKGSDLRQKGKVAELALGYQGASGALIAMGALDMGLTEAELPEIVERWRAANRRIVDLWYSIERAAFEAMKQGVSGAAKGILFGVENAGGHSYLTIMLPSGRKLYYCDPFISKNELGRSALYYYGTDQKTGKWGAISTYGGKLTENIVQAIARDCLAESMSALEACGFKIVMHVHDEVVIETPKVYAQDVMRAACSVMGTPIAWAPGLQLRADAFISEFYKKD